MYTGVLSGQSPSHAWGNLESKYSDTVVKCWYLWVPAMTFNFAFIPPQYRILFMTSVGVIWNSILSLLAHGPSTKQVQAEVVEEPKVGEASVEKVVEGGLSGDLSVVGSVKGDVVEVK